MIKRILEGKHVMIANSKLNEIWAQILQKKYSLPIHLSEEKVFLSLYGIAFSKFLPEKYLININSM